jgi:hypothetical protein
MRMLNQENGWLKITSIEEWGNVDDLIKGGHDGVIKDLHWSHGEYVDTGLNMVFGGDPTVWILIQLQCETVSSIEFLLKGVQELHLNVRDELIMGVDINENSICLNLSGHGQNKIVAREILYRISQPPLLGNDNYNYDYRV